MRDQTRCVDCGKRQVGYPPSSRRDKNESAVWASHGSLSPAPQQRTRWRAQRVAQDWRSYPFSCSVLHRGQTNILPLNASITTSPLSRSFATKTAHGLGIRRHRFAMPALSCDGLKIPDSRSPSRGLYQHGCAKFALSTPCAQLLGFTTPE